MSYGLECPYCEADLGEPDDCNLPLENYEHECHECGKYFIFNVEYEKTYHPYQADCLNGGEHKYKPIRGYPEEYYRGRHRCEDCDHETMIDAAANPR